MKNIDEFLAGNPTIPELLQERARRLGEAEVMVRALCGDGPRAMTPAELRQYDCLVADAKRIDDVYREQRRLSGATPTLHPVT